MNTSPQINIIIPLYNEEEVFDKLTLRINRLIESTKLEVSVILIDDGSTDNTPHLMEKLSLNDSRYSSIFLSRNFGHQLALTSGLSHVDCSEAVLIIDGDLQDPPELLDEFYSFYEKGYDVVYAVRKKRKEFFLKTLAYKAFYRILKRVSYLDIPLDSGDFSLVSRRVVDQMNQMKEESRFLRGMRSWVGYKQIGVPYERAERSSGTSKYTLKKLIQLAFNGLFNFSEFPIRFISVLGILTVSLSLIYWVVTLFYRIFYNIVPQGFTTLILAIILFGGVQLISIGILGEYIIRIFFQVKNRPLFVVKNKIHNQKKVDPKELY